MRPVRADWTPAGTAVEWPRGSGAGSPGSSWDEEAPPVARWTA